VTKVGAEAGIRIFLQALAFRAFETGAQHSRQVIDRRGVSIDLLLLLDDVPDQVKKDMMLTRGNLKKSMMLRVETVVDQLLDELPFSLRPPGPLPDLKRREKKRFLSEDLAEPHLL
jgi:hypothetical protein